MRQNPQGHAKILTAEYDDALRKISAPTSAESLTSKSIFSMAVDPDYMRNLAPIHGQAANTFAAAMHKYSTGLAAALPAAASAYADTDEWATKSLNSQLA